MTAPTPPFARLTTVLERFACALAWTTQAGAALTYLAVTVWPGVWQPMLDKNPVGIVCLWAIAACMTFIWAVSLWEEQHRYYDRFVQRSSRKLGLISHASVLLVAALAALGSPARLGLWVVLGVLCFAAVATWGSWMETRFLSDDDQAVIDEIITRETAERVAVHEAGERARRRERLTGIAATLGYALTAPERSDGSAAAVKWAIPAGKHTPLVYFISNGNRMKIGTTTDLKRRIRTLALRPENVTLLVDGDQRRERGYHKQFADLRIGNTEWFAYEGALATHVQAQLAHHVQKGQPK